MMPVKTFTNALNTNHICKAVIHCSFTTEINSDFSFLSYHNEESLQHINDHDIISKSTCQFFMAVFLFIEMSTIIKPSEE